MAISPLRSASTPVSRMPVHDAGSARLQGGGVEGFSSAQKPGSRLSSPGLAALQQDGFDVGSPQGAELGKLLQDTLSALTSIVQ
ncbi:hypothetical protein [Corallococcus exercitus]|uniref:hypothetical protein n=1 Tax=Corallococcus exercitus TaxID=2316736 RepID=UPI0035D42C6A